MSRPLNGVVVVDLSQQLPGPFCTLLLAALGARVVKVEPPSGDPAREIDPEMFDRVNAGKEIVTLDLKTDGGRCRLDELVMSADVFVEGFRPGVTTRLGCDWSAVSQRNPRLVYCSLSGFGREGPLAARAAHDLNFLAVAAGLADGSTDGAALIRIPFVDLASGTNAAFAISAALLARERSGRGRYLDMSMLDTALVWSLAKLPRASGGEGGYGVFATSDGARVAVSVMETPMWQRLCDALGWRDWAADCALNAHDARRARAREVAERLESALLGLSLSQVLALADRYDLPITHVNGVDDLEDDAQVATRGILAPGRAWAPMGITGETLPWADARRRG